MRRFPGVTDEPSRGAAPGAAAPPSRPGYETAGEGPAAARRPQPRWGSGGRRSAGESGRLFPPRPRGSWAWAGPGARGPRRGGAAPRDRTRPGGACWALFGEACAVPAELYLKRADAPDSHSRIINKFSASVDQRVRGCWRRLPWGNVPRTGRARRRWAARALARGLGAFWVSQRETRVAASHRGSEEQFRCGCQLGQESNPNIEWWL